MEHKLATCSYCSGKGYHYLHGTRSDCLHCNRVGSYWVYRIGCEWKEHGYVGYQPTMDCIIEARRNGKAPLGLLKKYHKNWDDKIMLNMDKK